VPSQEQLRWLTLPPPLPPPNAGLEQLRACQRDRPPLLHLWRYQGPPLIFLYGGISNSENWGNQVGAFAERYRVILIASRGHGRSTRDARPYGYDLMADNVIALMDQLSVRKADIVDWSDGGKIGLSIVLRYPERLDRLFVFGANSDPSGVMPPDEKNPVFALLVPRLAGEYRRLSPTPDKFETLSVEIGQMWAMQPRWSEADLARIRNPVAIADGDHEEMIFRTHTEQMTRQIPRAIDFVARRFALRPISGSSAVQRSRTQFPRSAVTAPADYAWAKDTAQATE
jgi:pimeloyl-ACP methyl ester carboxylesterase